MIWLSYHNFKFVSKLRCHSLEVLTSFSMLNMGTGCFDGVRPLKACLGVEKVLDSL